MKYILNKDALVETINGFITVKKGTIIHQNDLYNDRCFIGIVYYQPNYLLKYSIPLEWFVKYNDVEEVTEDI